MITNQEADILRHTSNNGRYVTDERHVIALAGRGLLYDHGPQALADGAHYLVMTSKGREALNDWYHAQPKPKKTRRQSRAFEAWRIHRELGCSLNFPQFLKHTWPSIR